MTLAPLYFAFGSNLSAPRLRARLPAAKPLGRAALPGYRLTFAKPGRDGSGKGDLRADPRGQVWGRLYRLNPRDLSLLDAVEGPGYQRVALWVHCHGRRQRAWLYRAKAPISQLLPFDWYLHHLRWGAMEARLPARYQRHLAQQPCCIDPDPQRAAREWRLYPASSGPSAGPGFDSAIDPLR
ncbi:gamma-glutamylcyclotransferase family protein [Ferrimonas marina]|uniref:AIG2-like family protein n=1 Tax=Ferrimonas marina TaxID=299255 RepID=A0A1M5RT09_9GAMM|nr:gamma-glutamylcyclotransferase family protein [Ferrimonas marina]SHH28943.1 AIG2-like family protein [Ferrimonas marina]